MEQRYLTRARAALARQVTNNEQSPTAAIPVVPAPTKETKKVPAPAADPFFVARNTIAATRWQLRVRQARIAAAYDALPLEQRPDLGASEWRGLQAAVDAAARMADAAALAAACDALDRRVALPPWEQDQAVDEWADLRALLAGGLLAHVGPLTLSTDAQLWDVAGCCQAWLDELHWSTLRQNAAHQLRALRAALGGPGDATA